MTMHARLLLALAAAALIVNGCASRDGQSAAEADAQESALAIPLPPAANAPAACTTDSDCRLFDDYCGGCNCRAVGATQAIPSCKGKTSVACFVAPCRELSPVCLEGTCTASGGAL